MSEQKKYSAPAVDRALSIMEVLSENPKGLTLNNIGEKLGLDINNIYRICMTLQERGYLQKDEETKNFMLTRKILALGYSAMSVDSIVDVSLSVMKELRDITMETTFLCVLVDNECVTLEQVLAKHPFKFSVQLGAKNSLYTSAASKALIAWLPQQELKKLVNSIDFKIFNEQTLKNSTELLKNLELTRQRGYAIDHAEEILGVHCIGAPIIDYKNNIVASLSITAPSNRIPEDKFEKYGNIVKEHAAKLSGILGGKPL